MRRLAALGVWGLCLAASAGTPEGSELKAPAATASPKKQAATPPAAQKEPSAKYTVTRENLDRYIRYRQESDAALLSATQAMAQGSEETVNLMSHLQKMRQIDLAMREKHGFVGDDIEQLDRMVRGVSNARFMGESAMLKATLKANEQRAATAPKGPEQDLAKGLAAMLREQMESDPELREQRAEYGDANVDVILKRESALKELWLRADAEAAKMFDALGKQPPGTISL